VILLLKVIALPAQMLLVGADIAIVGVTLFTVMVMVLLVAVVLVVQEALLVSTQRTALPFINEELENVALFVPTTVPFTRH
jgi:hypothetical protein